MKVGVLVSGAGSILEAMIAEGVPIALVAADRDCNALAIAARAGIATELVERADFGANFDRAWYTGKLVHVLKNHDVGLVAMSGFMTVLSPEFFDAFPGQVLNTHPSLLPLFKGDRAVEDALAAGATETGCTIHIATPELDEGRILAQEKVAVMPGDNVATLHERIKQVERKLYPRVLKDILSGAIIPGYN